MDNENSQIYYKMKEIIGGKIDKKYFFIYYDAYQVSSVILYYLWNIPQQQ